MMIAIMVWGQKWRGCNVVVNCDNEAVVTVLGSRYSREPHLMHVLRVLFFADWYVLFVVV